MNCKNCSIPLEDQQSFCHECGAKVIRNRLTSKGLWSEFIEKVLNIDNTLFRTYRSLFLKPEDVIGGYINGVRKRYINVFSYYALALTIAGFELFFLRKVRPEAFDLNPIISSAGGAPSMNPNVDWVYDYYSILTLLNLPLYALISMFTFWGLKKFNYVEHLVVNTYVLGQYTITNFFFIVPLVLIGMNFYLAGNVLTVFMFIYYLYVYKRLYPLSLKQLLIRFLVFLGILLLLFIVIGIIQFMVIYLSGDLDKMIEDAVRQQQEI